MLVTIFSKIWLVCSVPQRTKFLKYHEKRASLVRAYLIFLVDPVEREVEAGGRHEVAVVAHPLGVGVLAAGVYAARCEDGDG